MISPIYSKLTDAERADILIRYKMVASIPMKTDFGHKCAIVAHEICGDKIWNTKKGADYWALVVTAVVFSGLVEGYDVVDKIQNVMKG